VPMAESKAITLAWSGAGSAAADGLSPESISPPLELFFVEIARELVTRGAD